MIYRDANSEPDPRPAVSDFEEVDDMEVGRCSCGLIFYSMEYALDHECLRDRSDYCADDLRSGDPYGR